MNVLLGVALINSCIVCSGKELIDIVDAYDEDYIFDEALDGLIQHQADDTIPTEDYQKDFEATYEFGNKDVTLAKDNSIDSSNATEEAISTNEDASESNRLINPTAGLVFTVMGVMQLLMILVVGANFWMRRTRGGNRKRGRRVASVKVQLITEAIDVERSTNLTPAAV